MFALLLAYNPGDAYEPLLGFDLNFINTIWFVWINLIFIVAILSWLLYKPLMKFLNDRRERIKNEIAAAAENFKKAEEARITYDAKLSRIAQEREEILDAAKKTAQAREGEIIAAAKSEVDLIMSRARRDIEQEREKAKEEVHRQIVQVSVLMAEKLIGSQLNTDEAARERLLNQAIAELGSAE